MSVNDVLVIVGCLVLGYVVVSFLMGGNKPPSGTKQAPPFAGSARPAGATAAPGAQADIAGPPHWSDVLEVARDASVEEIRAAYRRLISQYHPDKVATLGQALRELAEVKSRDITHAYQAAIRERAAT
jgi:DnaJ like chaperone protein